MQGVDENGAVRFAGLSHDGERLWQRPIGRQGMNSKSMRRPNANARSQSSAKCAVSRAWFAVVTGYGDRNGAEIGGGLEHTRRGLHVDIRRELDEFDVAHADTLPRQDLLERAVGFRSDPRRIGRAPDGRRHNPQANRREAGARRLGDQRGQRKFEGRQVSKAEHQARHLLRPLINPWDSCN